MNIHRLRGVSNVLIASILIFLGMPMQGMANTELEKSYYIEPKVSYTHVNLPEYSPLALRRRDRSFIKGLTTHDGHMSGPSAGLTVGWRFKNAFNPKKEMFLEASGSFLYMKSEQSDLFAYSPDYKLGWYAIGGEVTSLAFVAGEDIQSESERRVKQFDRELLFGITIPIKENYLLTPFLGYAGLYLGQDFSTNAHLVQRPDEVMSLSEEVIGKYNGGLLGVRFKYVEDFYELFVSASVAVMHVDGKYDGDQYYSYGDGQYSTESDKTTTTALRERIRVGGRRFIGNLQLGFNLAYEYLNAVPKINASTKMSTDSDNVPTSHIGWGESHSFAVGIDARYAF